MEKNLVKKLILMKQSCDSSKNIIPPEIVNQHREEADRIEGNPAAMLALIDLIFGFEPDRNPPS